MTTNYYILLSGPTDNTVKVADPQGNFLGNLVTSGSGGLFGTDGLEITPDGDLLVGTVLGENVLRYDGRTGTFIDEFLAPDSGGFADPNRQTGLDTVTQIKFGPDGNLYVSNFISFDGFNPATREPIFSTNPRESVDNILVFDPDGNFVTQYDFPRQDPATPLGIEFVGNKLIVAAREHNTIYKFDDITTASRTQPNLLTPFINGDDPNVPLDGPAGLLVASDGKIYTTSLDSQEIQTYDANNGSFLGIFVDDTNEKGLTGPSALLETPSGVATPSGGTELVVTGFSSLNAGRIDFEGEGAGNVLDLFIPPGGNDTWGFGKNEGAIIVTPEMIGGELNFPVPYPTNYSLYVSNVNNTFAVGPVVNITLDENNNIASVSPNFEAGVYYSSVLEYDAVTGEFLGDFVPKGNANQDGIFFSSGITFKDGFLYANDQGYQVDPTVTDPADSRYGRILKFDATTGTLLGEFISGEKLTEHGLNFPEDLLFGPDGNLYVSGLGGGGVQIFDGATGEYLKTISEINPFTNSDLIAAGLNFGPDGNLYISSVLNDNSILRYNLDTGSLDPHRLPPSDAPAIPSGSVFTPDGSLFLNATFVSVDGSPIGINQYSGQNAQPEGYFVDPSNNGGLNSVSRMKFDLQGNLYVSDFAGSQIVRFDDQGEPIGEGVFVASGVGGLNNPGGIAFSPTSTQNEPDTSPVYRLWNPTIGDHFYTTNSQEAMKAVSLFNYETYYAGFNAPKEDGLAVYRGWNPNIGDHFYTTNLDEFNKAVNNFGYVNEGIAFYAVSNPSLGEEVYRGWNPTIGDHFYTTNLDEFNKAVNNFGYINEGVAFYAYV
jgi:WD40 repeat protein